MEGTLHFALLASNVGVTILAIRMSFKSPTWRRGLAGIVAGLVSAAIQVSISIHACRAGDPIMQWLLPSTCLVACVLFVGRTWLRRILVATTFVLGLGLSFRYSEVVHGPTWIGVAQPDATYAEIGAKAQWHTWLTGLYRRVY